MSKFKVGDKVRVVDAEDLRGDIREYMLNRETEIVAVYGSDYHIKDNSFSNNPEHPWWVHESWLEPVEDSPTYYPPFDGEIRGFNTPPAESITYQVNDLTVTMEKGKLTINGTTLNANHAETLVSLIREFVV